MGIRVTQVRNADLNLLVYFTVLAEERSLTRAAKRLFLTQPSMTRALKKLRDLFADDLLIRTSNEYGLTPKGEALLREVSQFLPRLDRLISGSDFDPYSESAHFRVAATDNASALYGPTLAKLFASWNRVSFSFRPWTDDFSSVFPLPAWQTNVSASFGPVGRVGRALPDVAAHASPSF